jgi:Na+-driven multidrug efflux pump
VALGLQLKATIVAFPVLIVNIILSIMMVSWGYGIEGVALASSVSFLLMFTALFSFVWWQLRFRDHGLTKRFFWFFVPFPVMCTLLFVPDKLSVGLEESPMLFLSVKMLIFITLQGLLLHLVRTAGLVSFRIES